jgi:hypothetical protein
MLDEWELGVCPGESPGETPPADALPILMLRVCADSLNALNEMGMAVEDTTVSSCTVYEEDRGDADPFERCPWWEESSNGE